MICTQIGVYGRPEQRPMADVAAGLKSLDRRFVWRRDGVFTPDQVEPFDLVFVHGLSGRGVVVRDAYMARDVPVVVVDYPHLRTPGWQAAGVQRLSLGRHDWLPDYPCAPERLRKLGVAPKRAKLGRGVLLCGQMPADSQHDLQAHQLQEWSQATFETLRMLVEEPVAWRPHPGAAMSVRGATRTSDPATQDIATALAGLRVLATYNSTAGLEALIAGYPVVAEGAAVYSSLAGKLKDVLDIKSPPLDRVAALLRQIAWTQWTRSEIKSGEALRFMFDTIAGKRPGRAVAPVEPIQQAKVAEPAQPAPPPTPPESPPPRPEPEPEPVTPEVERSDEQADAPDELPDEPSPLAAWIEELEALDGRRLLPARKRALRKFLHKATGKLPGGRTKEAGFLAQLQDLVGGS